MMRPLVLATAVGAVLQLVMVLWGHVEPAVAGLFALGGMGISLLAGLAYAMLARPGVVAAAVGGAIAGGLCGLIGIAVSLALGDVEPMLLVLGTASSAVTGAVGGAVGAVLVRRPTAKA